MQRRRLLTSVGVVATGSLAGCLGPTSKGKRPLSTNPVGQNLDQQPRIGLPRGETGRTLVMFHSPACPKCKTFHRDTFSEIRDEWVEQGEATVYARNPNVTGWAVEAVHALEETRLRSPALYWVLRARYYEHQGEMSRGNVVEKTRSFLEGEDIDADAVARAASNKAHSEAIEMDASAFGEAVHIRTTPTHWLFEDGEFVTTIGNRGFDAFVSAVESHE